MEAKVSEAALAALAVANITPSEVLKDGTILVYHKERGYGFIKELNTPLLESGIPLFVNWFFHVNDCSCEPVVGLRVQFTPGEGRKGPAAMKVRAVSGGAL